ncbi:MAG: hypothetical protein B6D58_05505 [candidate division Zixibacteria bacterium 4484_95]|nr:MAG: hypothetical protein B6D58_05505 [candidate division Zixibacteria bacterium 4484_95]
MKKITIFLLFLTTTVFGQVEYFGQNKVQYKSFEWYYIQTRNFDIYFNEKQDTIAYFAAEVLDDAYKQVSKELNHSLTARVPIIIYSSPNDFQQTNVIPDILPEGVGGFTEVFKNRIVVPFNGSYEDFRHVLHHELTHAVVFNLLYENAISSLISRQALFQPPLWFNEGYAEYSSRKGWDYEADMFLRDAITGGYLPPLTEMYGFLNYKGGQAAVLYIAETFGYQKIYEIYNKGKVRLTMEKAVKEALGMSQEKLSKDWHRELRRIYWPEISKRKTVDETGKLITNHDEDGSIYNQNPAWSPKGDRLAITSDRASPQDGFSERFNEIYIVSSVDGKVIERLVKAERSGDLESLHSYVSGASWSPDGLKLVFVSKSHGQDALFFIDAESKKIYKRFRPRLDGIKSPDWSPAGDKVVLTGIKNGFSDLYIFDIENESFNRLTYDRYDDIDADFSSDGTKIAFASDRPVNGVNDTTFTYGHYNVFIIDLLKNEIEPLTDDDTKCIQPDFSSDGNMLAYVSYRNGIANIYIHDFEDGDDFPVTDVLTGVFSPSWSPDGSKIAVSAFNNLGYDIVIIRDIKPATEKDMLEPTSFRKIGRLYTHATPVALDMQEEKEEEQKETHSIDYSHYIFSPGGKIQEHDMQGPDSNQVKEKEDIGKEPVDSLEYMEADGTYKKKKYKLRFSPELVSGGFSYDSFYGLQGQSFIAISDIFGNHHFYIMTDVFNSIDQSNIQIMYSYLANRLDYAVSIFHFKDLYFDDYNKTYFSDRLYGAVGLISYPFSKFSRLDINLTQITIDRNYYEPVPPEFTDGISNFLVGNLDYVSDGVIWGIVGPVSGQRYKLSVEKSFKAVSSGYSYTSFKMDYRRYFHFGDAYNFAFRFTGGASYGKNAKKYYLGGTSYWIGPRQSTNDIYSEEDIYVNELVVPLRGYSYFEFSGKKYVLINLELRYPFIDYFKMRVPLGLTLSRVRGSIFWDVGAAFDKVDEFLLFDEDYGFPKLGTPKSGIGFSTQTNLGIFVLRFDVAWKTDLNSIAHKPNYYFSFGANY